MRRLLPLAALLAATLSTHAASPIATESSAFLRSYADGPVNWMPWGEPAFTRAKQEQKPVLLVIGSFTSELSRAMHRQTFSNAETAAFLNDTFVCILVDAKEQREVTALYQQYLQTVKQLSGLPMNLWLTPELKPFDGANYLPPTEEWGKEGFSTVAKRAAAAWKADAAAQRAKATEAVTTVVAAQPTTAAEAVDAAAITRLLTDAKEAWRARFDAANGGFGDPPKYPEPELLRYLLRDPASQEMALTTLRAVINGAVRDPLDGGFFRYAVDAEWRHPYFQKTLADQARLALALLDAAKLTDHAQFAEAARGALHYALTQLRTKEGDFCGAEDSTPDAVTASYFWTVAEIRDVLGEAFAKEFSSAYSVTAEGNIPADAFPGATTTGKNILYRATPAPNAATEKSLQASSTKLLAKRQSRASALRDDNATSGTHGLLLEALSRASLQLQDPQLTASAKDEYAFIREKLLLPDGGVRRLAGRSVAAATEDYGFLIAGLLEYDTVAKDSGAAALAEKLLNAANTHFWSEKTGRYFAVGPTPDQGTWARVVYSTPGPADLPSTEATLLRALESHPAAKSSADLVAALRRTIAADVKDAGEVARGDLLLSLQPKDR